MLVGRDSEMTQLVEVLRGGKHALVVISSEPGMGRSALLEEFRSLAEKMNWRILPGVSSEEDSPGTIEIKWNTTKKDFLDKVSFTLPQGIKADDLRIQITSLYQSSAVPKSAKDETGKKVVSVVSAQSADTVFQATDIKQGALQERANVLSPSGKPRPTTEVGQVLGGTLILIDSYHPDKKFETWFLGHYIPGMRRATSPVVIVVAGYSGDLAALAEAADRRIELGLLPIQATTEYFSSLNNHIEVRMQEKEVEAYASASAKDPSLIDALTRLLKLK